MLAGSLVLGGAQAGVRQGRFVAPGDAPREEADRQTLVIFIIDRMGRPRWSPSR